MLRYFAKCAKRVSVAETEESDVSDKRQRDGIGGEASVNVTIGGETSVNDTIIGETLVAVAAVDNKPLTDAVSAPCNHAPVLGNAAAPAGTS